MGDTSPSGAEALLYIKRTRALLVLRLFNTAELVGGVSLFKAALE